MLNQKPVNKIIFLDIETTSQSPNFKSLSSIKRLLFMERFKKDINMTIDEIYKKHKSKSNDFLKKMEEVYNIKAPVFPEFGKILVISIGVLWEKEGVWNIKTTSFKSDNEKELLEEFINHEHLGKIWNNIPGKWEKNIENFYSICAHNGHVFDFPFIAKRLIINGINPPPMFDFAHLKPWEINFLIDTKKEWSFGVWDGSFSLKLLCDIFNVDTPKDDISGADVKDVYWKENDLDRIATYCEKDVKALAEVYLRMKCDNKPLKWYNNKEADKNE